jgi:predicted dehydrogenase
VIAIIGQGRMAKAHARAWSNLGLGDDIRYVCARGPQVPFEYANAARFVTDLDVVLADRQVSVVSVCTPTPTHADIAIRALAAGKNVLLEKPIALTLPDARAIRDAAEAGTGMLMVAHVVRFFPGYRKLAQDAENGAFGRLVSVRARRISASGERKPWMLDEAQSGGMLVDFAIHDFDQVNLYLGAPVAVTAVRASAPGPSGTVAVESTVEYVDGGLGQVLSCLSMPAGTPFTSSVEVLGTGGLADYRFSDTSPTDIAVDDPYTLQAEYFMRCVNSGTPPALCPVDSAIAALTLSLAARDALASGARTLIPPA